ncbi:murein biosynthesis integral membrane protein MurJ [Candidatus Curtissbacteria bacterium]|nr:murein biosynthesis integral membrane protein MurJ [Candidatus Curtissbacteria bacterium]
MAKIITFVKRTYHMLEIFKNGSSIFKKKQEDILSAAFIIAFSVALSRFLGLIRYRLLASHFGNDIKLLDSFIAASILPDAIFEVLIFGAIALAFIPVFSQYLTKEKLQKAWDLSSSMITLALITFTLFTVIILLLADFIAPLIAPGLVAKEPATRLLIGSLLRIMIFAQLFFVVSIFLTGILQSFQRFLVPAIASICYNLGIILAIIFLTPYIGIYAPAVGMILGALLHLLIQLPLAFALGFRYRPKLDFKNKDVRTTFALMWPRSFSLGLIRLADIINVAIASIAAVGSIVAFNFAQVLQLVPTSLFAASLAQAALPSLSIQFNSNRSQTFKKLFAESFHQIIFLVLPTASILAILRIPIVRLVFGAKDFPWDITVLTGRLLIAFAIGIIGQSLSLLLTRSFYAIKDSATPVKIEIFTISLNIIASFVLVLYLKLPLVFLAVNYSIANLLNATLLFYFLNRKVKFELKPLLVPALKMLLITAITAISLYIPMKFLDQLVFDTTHVVGLILLTGTAVIAGLLVYIALSWLFRIQEVSIFYNLGKRVISFPSRLAKPAPTVMDAQQPNP